MGYTKSTLGISVLFFLSVIVIMTGTASADVGVMAVGDVKINVVSDNFTFNFSNYAPVVKGFTVLDDEGNLTADTFNWTLFEGGTQIDYVPDTSDNYTTFTFSHPGIYELKTFGWNGSNPSAAVALNRSDIFAQLPILGSPEVLVGPYNREYQFRYVTDNYSAIPDKINGQVWKYSDGTTNSSTYPTLENHTFPYFSPYEQRTFTYNVTVYNKTPDMDAIYLPNRSIDYTLTVSPPPVSDFYIVDNDTKAPARVVPVPFYGDFINNSSTFPGYSGAPFSFAWNLSGGSSPLQTSANVTNYLYEEPGTFNITLRTFSDYGWNETNKTLVTYENISANFTTVQSPCAAFPVNVMFKDNSTGSLIDLWAWDFGDGNKLNVTTNQTNHTYYQPGEYDVTLTGVNTTISPGFNITNQTTQKVTITGVFANFTSDPGERTIFRGQKALFNFTDISSGITFADKFFTWEFEPGQKSYERNPSWNFTQNGTYNISLTVYNRTCGISSSNTTIKQVRVYEYLEPNISYTPKCGAFPLNVTLTDTSTDEPSRWLWHIYDIHGNQVTTIEGPVVTYGYPTPGTYKVGLTIENNRGQSFDKEPFYISLTDCIQANFTANQTRGYYPFTVNFTDISTPSGSVNTRVWNFDDQSSSGSQVTEIHTFAQKGNYNVSLTITNTSTGMVKIANKTIEVGSPVYANFSPNNSAVVPVNTSMLVNFTDLSGPQGEITNWDWNFEDKLPNDTNQSPWHKFTTEGIHNVTLNVSNPYYGAKDVMRTQVNISVQKSPIVDFTFQPDVPSANEIVSFSDGSSGQERNAWLWEFGDGNTSTAVNPTYRYPYAGSYTVNLTVSNPYGNGTASHVVRVKGNVTASFITVPADWGIINQPVTFIDTSKGQPIQWTWNFGDGNITPTQAPQIDHIYTSAGWYTINMTGTNWDGQSGSAVRQIYIDNKTRPRDVDFGVEGKKYSGNHPLTVQFEDFTPSQSNVTEWYWDFGDRTNSFNTTPVAPSHTYTQPGQYTVTLTVRNEAGVNEKMKVAYVVVV